MAGPQVDPLLSDLEARMAAQHLRGQWQVDPNRPQNVRKGANGQVQIDPVPSGVPHIWKWQDMLPLLHSACQAMTESYTARRTLTFKNPSLQRGTTQTLVAGFQIVPPGEVAWAHRHTMSALRFTVQGNEKAFTVVDGRPLVMEPYDLILTPGWSWHDHHNESQQDAIWMDGLDVPFILALNQAFYEEPGEVAQERRVEERRVDDDALSPLLRPAGPQSADGGARPYRYAWKDTLRILHARTHDPIHPHLGHVLEFVNPATNGAVLPTIGCQIQHLPPGFEGEPYRHTSSSIAFVIEGEGCMAVGEREIQWAKHDTLAIPNWTWHRQINRSKREPAILFVMTDTPILAAFGLYREETEDRVNVSPAPSGFKLSAAE
jgi:1-hydroxy-2-naphthoate dioxygenase